MTNPETCEEMILSDMHVSLRGSQRCMPEHLLNDPEVRTVPEQ